MNSIVAYWILFVIRTIVCIIVVHKYGWRAMSYMFLYLLATAISDKVAPR